MVVETLEQPIGLERLGRASEELSYDLVRGLIPHGSMAIIDLNEEGLSVKRLHFQQNEGGDWSLILEADNRAWAHDSGYPRHLRREDELTVYARVLGLAK